MHCLLCSRRLGICPAHFVDYFPGSSRPPHRFDLAQPWPRPQLDHPTKATASLHQLHGTPAVVAPGNRQRSPQPTPQELPSIPFSSDEKRDLQTTNLCHQMDQPILAHPCCSSATCRQLPSLQRSLKILRYQKAYRPVVYETFVFARLHQNLRCRYLVQQIVHPYQNLLLFDFAGDLT